MNLYSVHVDEYIIMPPDPLSPDEPKFVWKTVRGKDRIPDFLALDADKAKDHVVRCVRRIQGADFKGAPAWIDGDEDEDWVSEYNWTLKTPKWRFMLHEWDGIREMIEIDSDMPTRFLLTLWRKHKDDIITMATDKYI